jgi:hypothetical protein
VIYISTSPPVSPSPPEERGKNIKKRGFAPLKHPICDLLLRITGTKIYSLILRGK